MLSILDRMIGKLTKIVLMTLIALGIVMLVVAWAHVFYRYVLNSSLTWSEELLKILLVWFCLLSTTIIAVHREHVSIVIFKEMMPKKINHALTLLAQIFMFLASGLVFAIGINFVIEAGSRSTPALGCPYAVAYAAIPVAFAILTLYEFRNTAADFTKGPRLATKLKEHD